MFHGLVLALKSVRSSQMTSSPKKVKPGESHGKRGFRLPPFFPRFTGKNPWVSPKILQRRSVELGSLIVFLSEIRTFSCIKMTNYHIIDRWVGCSEKDTLIFQSTWETRFCLAVAPLLDRTKLLKKQKLGNGVS